MGCTVVELERGVEVIGDVESGGGGLETVCASPDFDRLGQNGEVVASATDEVHLAV